MPIKIAINGFGRIGRSAFKVLSGIPSQQCDISPRLNPSEVEIVAINDLTPPEDLAYLLKYDTVYGKLPVSVEGKSGKDVKAGGLKVEAKKIPVFSEKDPANLPWKSLNVDVVIESTGLFTDYTKAAAHLEAGSKRVIISAPAKGDETSEHNTQIFGTDKTKTLFDKKNEIKIVSNASCTTNSIAPVMQVMCEEFGVEKALMSTVHGYTSTQNLVDGPNKKIRRGRAAAQNIVPTTTGAAVATTRVIPELSEKFDGVAIRVPVICGSVSDITMVTSKSVSVEDINNALRNASESNDYKHILAVSNDPIVSSDIVGRYESAIVDMEYTRVTGDNLVKVMVWYDNEWGYSNRLAEMALAVGNNI